MPFADLLSRLTADPSSFAVVLYFRSTLHYAPFLLKAAPTEAAGDVAQLADLDAAEEAAIQPGAAAMDDAATAQRMEELGLTWGNDFQTVMIGGADMDIERVEALLNDMGADEMEIRTPSRIYDIQRSLHGLKALLVNTRMPDEDYDDEAMSTADDPDTECIDIPGSWVAKAAAAAADDDDADDAGDDAAFAAVADVDVRREAMAALQRASHPEHLSRKDVRLEAEAALGCDLSAWRNVIKATCAEWLAARA